MCVIIKSLVYSIQDNTHNIPMDCGKFHMMDDMKFLLSTVRSECQQCSYKLNHAHIQNSRHNIRILELSQV